MPTHEYPDTPRVAVGAVLMHEKKVLLCRRGKPPAEGEWAIPGGSVELAETLQKAAEREILEEAGIIVKAGEPIHVFDVITKDKVRRIRFHYVIVDLLCYYVSGDLKAGDDAREIRWLGPDDLQELHVNTNTLILLRKLHFFEK